MAGADTDDCASPCPHPCPNLVPKCPAPIITVASIPCELVEIPAPDCTPITLIVAPEPSVDLGPTRNALYPYPGSLIVAAGPSEVFLGAAYHPKRSRFSPMIWVSHRDLHADRGNCVDSRNGGPMEEPPGNDDDDSYNPYDSYKPMCYEGAQPLPTERDEEFAAGVGVIIGLGKRR